MAKKDILLRAGITFSPRDVDTKAIRTAVVKSLSTTRVKINKVTLGRDARTSLQESIRKLRIRVDSAAIGRTGKTALKASFQTIAFKINNATFSAQAIRQLQTQLSQIRATIQPAAGGKPISPVAPGAADNVAKLQQQVAKLQQQLQATRSQLGQFSTGATNAAGATRSLGKATTTSQKGLVGFGNNIAKITTRFTAYLISLRLILGVQQAFTASLDVIFTFDAAIQDLAKVLTDLGTSLPIASAGILNLSTTTGAAFEEISASVGTFVRAGLNIEEALDRAEVAIRATQVSELALNEATKVITTSLQVFGDEIRDAGEALDVISFISDRAATSADQVARAIIRSGAAAEATGIGFRQLIGIIAATTETTQQSASTIGAALKTIFASLAGNEQKLRDVADSLGVNIEVGASLFQILKSLAEVSDQFTRSQIAQLTALVGGKRRFTEFNALLTSFEKAERLAEESVNAAGTAIGKQEKEFQKLENIVARTQAELAKFVIQLVGAEEGAEATGGIRQGFAQILEGVNSVVGVINEAISGLKEFEGVASVLGGVFGSLVKVGFLKLGPKIIIQIIQGIRNFAKETRNVSASLKTVATSQRQVTGSVDKTNAAQKKVNLSLKEQERRLRTIADLNRIVGRETIARQPRILNRGQIRPGAGRGRRGAEGGGGALRGIALVIALDTLAGQLTELGDRSSELAKLFGGDLDKSTKLFLNNVGKMSGNALQVATTFGLLLGPVVGVTAGIVAFSAAIIQGAIELRSATLAAAAATEKLAAKTLTAEQAAEKFGDAGSQAVEDLAGLNGIAGESAVLQRVLRELSDGGLTLESSIRSMNDAFQLGIDVFARAENEIRIERATAGDRARIESQRGGFDLRAEAAGTTKEFEKLLDAQIKSRELINKFKGDQVEIRNSMDLISRIQTAINAKEAGLVNQAADALKNVGLTTNELQIQESAVSAARTAFQDSEEQTRKLRQQVELVTKSLGENKKTIEATIVANEALLQVQKKQGVDAELIKNTESEIIAGKKELVQIQNTLNKANEDLTEFQSAQDKAGAQLSEQEAKHRDILKDVNEQLNISLSRRKQEADILNVITSQINNNAAQSQAETEFQNSRFAIRKAQIQEELRGGTIAERNQQRINALEADLFEKVDRVSFARNKELELIKQRIALLKSQDADDDLAASLERNIPAFEAAIKKEAEALKQEAEIQFRLELLEINAENIKRAEDSLLQFRLNQLDQIRRKEEEVTARRIATIERLAKSAEGREFIRDEIRPQAGLVRDFGAVQAALIEETTKATERAVEGMLEELDELRTGGRFSASQLVADQEKLIQIEAELVRARTVGDKEAIATAEQEAREVKKSIADMLAAGTQAFENLGKRQQAIAKLTESQEVRSAVKRNAALKNLEDASKRVASAEKSLVTERNKIPALNAKIIAAQKKLASANVEVEESTRNLIAANQALADAQFKLNFDISLAAFKARQSVGAFQGPADAIGALAGAFNSAVSSIKASGEAILEARRAVLQEELSIVQNQLQSFKSLAIEAATASPEDLANLRNGLQTALEVAAGQVDLGSLDDETRASLSKFTDIVPKLENALLKFGAEQLGLDPSLFQTFENQIVELSTGIAETGKTAVIAAEEQVAAARAQLDEARQTRETAESQLNVALEQKEVQLSIAGQAARQVSVARTGFTEQRRLTNRQLKQFAAGVIVDKDIKEAIDAQKALLQLELKEIQDFGATAKESLENSKRILISSDKVATNTDAIVPLEQRVATATENTAANTKATISAIENLQIKINAAQSAVTGQATGTLSNGEINGLLAAAKREKRAMPGGANLMLANTSETVLTRNQSKKVGLSYKGHVPNAQEGFGVISDISAVNTLNERISNLEGSIRKLSDNVTAQGPIQVNVDTQRSITVNGLAELPAAVQRAVEDRLGGTPTQAEVDGVKTSVTEVLNRLKEQGLEDFS